MSHGIAALWETVAECYCGALVPRGAPAPNHFTIHGVTYSPTLIHDLVVLVQSSADEDRLPALAFIYRTYPMHIFRAVMRDISP